MNIYFELKKISDKEGTIRAIVTESSKKAIISLGIKTPLNNWHKGKPKQLTKNANLNMTLNKYVKAFDQYITNTQLADELGSINKAKDYIKANVNSLNKERGKKDLNHILELFKTANEGKLTEGALKPYTTLINHLNDYKTNLQFSDFDEVFIDKFSLFLSKKSKHVAGATNLQNPTINKMIVTLKAFCKWAYKNKHTSATAWKEIKQVKEIDQRIITLTLDEFNTYANFDFSKSPKLGRQRDVFCFATYTGLRFEDLKQVSKNNIKKSAGEYYVHINTDKTSHELKIKLVQQAVEILKNYDFELPFITNQKTNEYIKEGLKKAKINRSETVIIQYLNKHETINRPLHELVSIHDARKTFVTLSLQAGMSISEVMAVSTHKDYRSFSRYVQLEAQRINNKLQSVFALSKVS